MNQNKIFTEDELDTIAVSLIDVCKTYILSKKSKGLKQEFAKKLDQYVDSKEVEE